MQNTVTIILMKPKAKRLYYCINSQLLNQLKIKKGCFVNAVRWSTVSMSLENKLVLLVFCFFFERQSKKVDAQVDF